MKSLHFFTVILTLSFSSIAFGQTMYFEGKIISKTSFEIKDSTRRALYFSNLYPNTTIQYFKAGNSFEIYDKGEVKTYLYVQEENRGYEKKWRNDTIFFFDCGKKGREILNYKISKNADTILGLACDKLQITYSGGTSSYYFNKDKVKINPSWYSRLTYINWDTLSKILQSIVLKTVIERHDYRITNIVTSLSNEKVPDEIFRIPSNAILIDDN